MITTVTPRIDGFDYPPFSGDNLAAGVPSLDQFVLGLQGSIAFAYEADYKNLTISSVAYGVGDIWSPAVTNGTLVPPFDSVTSSGIGTSTGDAINDLWTFTRGGVGGTIATANVGSAIPDGSYLEWFVQFDVRFRGIDAQSAIPSIIVATVHADIEDFTTAEAIFEEDLIVGVKHQWWQINANLFGGYIPSGDPFIPSGGYVAANSRFVVDDVWHTIGLHVVVSKTFVPPKLYVIDHLDHNFATIQTIFPENLNFVKNIRDASTINHELSFSAKDIDDSPAVYEHDIIRPFFTGWRLRYTNLDDIDVTIMEGIHTLCNVVAGDDFMKVGGVDYTGYLDHVMYPFNPQSPNDFRMKTDGTTADPDDYISPNPPRGMAYKVEKDVAQIINDLFAMCFSVDNRLPITCALSDFGYTTKFELALGDSQTLLEIIKGLADLDPGFDFVVNNDREFKAFTPFRYGTSDDPTIAYTFDTDHPGTELEFTVTGPKYTHLLGLATAPKSRLGRALGATLAEIAYWRLDGNEDFGEVVDQTEVNEKTKFALKFWNNPVHEIPLSVSVEVIQDLLGDDVFWEIFRAGFAIFIDWDLVYHRIDSAQRILSMDCKIDNDGNGIVAFGLNQIYDLTGIPGIEEG